MTRMTDAMATIDDLADRLLRIDKRLEGTAPGVNTNNVNTTFNAGGIGVLVGIAGVFLGLTGMYVINDRAESRMAILLEARRADMAAMTAVQSDVNFAKSQASTAKTLANEIDKDLGERIAKLEARK